MSPPIRPGDDVMVRRAARKVAAQVAALVFAALLLLVALVTVVVVRGQSGAADDLLRSTVASADDVGDPPPGTWLVLAGGGGVSSTPGLPGALSPQLTALRSRASRSTGLADLSVHDGRDYRVATRLRQGRTVQVVLDLTSQHVERRRLLRAMGVASLLGLLLAAGLGAVVGRRAVRPMARALALQRAFVADASHELRTPLTLLSTRAQVLDRAVQAGEVGAQVQHDSRGLVEDVLRLGEVVEDLLAAADPRGEETWVAVDLAHLARDVVASAEARAAEAGVTLRVDPTPAAVVRGSAPALRRALLSLVDNAIDHTPEHGTVLVEVMTQGKDVLLCVSDTGPGITSEAAPDVLRRFHSGGHRAGRAHYGLGLALTHDVANRHGGQLRLVPSEIGARFELVLPAFS